MLIVEKLRTRFQIALVATLLLAVGTAEARVNVVTLPTRDSVQLTIYNSEDLTLVKETRKLTFREGMNRLEFSWANTLIDPTSVEFRALTHADEVDVLDVSFPPRVTNTLEWRIRSEVAGEVEVEIRYFTSGISWAADYVVESERSEKEMALAGAVTVNNRSGEDYENAEVRLVVGVIRLVEKIADLARGPQTPSKPQPSAAPRSQVQKRQVMTALSGAAAPDMAKKREVKKESVGEYFLYTVEGRDTIPNGWRKRLPSFKTDDIPITSYYKYEKERWGNQVIRFYRFKNDEESELGTEPLPDGSVTAFRVVNDENLYSFVGRTRVKYIPLDETVDMELGGDKEVMIKPVLSGWNKTDVNFNGSGNVAGWTVTEDWRIELQNSKAIDVVVDVRRNFGGDWSMTSDDDYEKVDAQKVKFVVTLKPGEKKVLNYKLTTRHGVNVRK